ncbi:unnamed protein product [Linum tenue]|uniref:Pentatricopeptide repeat-containing protein n=1 Tax=Linum tenue TaxID=586396 RepID=A0AAV0IEI4_9ROSI|nr:unnamed protein product [Linum tenue]
MKRFFKISESEQLLSLHHKSLAQPTSALTPYSLAFTKSPAYPSGRNTDGPSAGTSRSVYELFIDKFSLAVDNRGRQILEEKVSRLADTLVLHADDFDKVAGVLEESGRSLLRRYNDGSAFLELLKILGRSSPQFALEVFNWRRANADWGIPLTSEEYARAIALAGRVKDVVLAAELFYEASNSRIRTTAIYNALMSVYMINGLADKCQLLFTELKREPSCAPSVVTYNILISVYGRLLLVDKMEAALQEAKDLNLAPNVSTYNNLIAGYLTAWRWDSMEKIFQRMKLDSVQPDVQTWLLMLRGYAHSGKLELMERTYELVRDHVDFKERPLISAMICAYCKSSVPNKLSRIEALVGLIPKEEYRPWLNVLLIKVYAREGCLERMEKSINEAFERQTIVTATGVMRAITGGYFKYDAVDRLANFIKRAETAGWRMCRSLFHGKMVLYGSENRLKEMENVLSEMDNVNLDCTKKTFYILYRSYSLWDQRDLAKKIIGLLYKRGHGIPADASLS